MSGGTVWRTYPGGTVWRTRQAVASETCNRVTQSGARRQLSLRHSRAGRNPSLRLNAPVIRSPSSPPPAPFAAAARYASAPSAMAGIDTAMPGARLDRRTSRTTSHVLSAVPPKNASAVVG